MIIEVRLRGIARAQAAATVYLQPVEEGREFNPWVQFSGLDVKLTDDELEAEARRRYKELVP